jgi:two-component system chemotaxis response regulator CheY
MKTIPRKQILSVGQCGFDHSAIDQMIRTHFETEALLADSAEEALAILRNGAVALVLINRVLDRDGSLGIELLKQIKSDRAFAFIPVMLVSNYEDAQEEAIEAGAVPGFGKAALGTPATIERLRRHLA